MLYLMLPVIVWSPQEQYPDYINNHFPKCEVPDSKLTPSGWTNGQSNENMPRLLHCVSTKVILVSRIYHCERNNHRVLAHHPDIIRSFAARNLLCLVPFHLWHITGFTLPLLEYITELLRQCLRLTEFVCFMT